MMKRLLSMVLIAIAIQTHAEPCLVYWRILHHGRFTLNGRPVTGEVAKRSMFPIFLAELDLKPGDTLGFQCSGRKLRHAGLYVAVFSANGRRYLFGTNPTDWVSSTHAPKPEWYAEPANGMLRRGNQQPKEMRRPTGLAKFLQFLGEPDLDLVPIWGNNRRAAFLKRTVTKRDIED